MNVVARTFDYRLSASGQQMHDPPESARSLIANRTLAVHQEVLAAQCHGSNVGPIGTLRQGNGGLTGGVPFVATLGTPEGVAHAISAREGKGPCSNVASGNVVAYSATDYKDGAYEEVEQAGPLTTSADRTRSAPIAFSVNQRREGRLREVHGSLNGDPSGTQVDGVLDPMFVHPRILRNSLSSNQVGIKDDGLSDALTSEGPGAVMQATPRRLTPVETSRLQGFPDDWNEWGLDESGNRVELSDSARYRQNGNAVTVTVSRWIGERILAAARASAGDAGAEREKEA